MQRALTSSRVFALLAFSCITACDSASNAPTSPRMVAPSAAAALVPGGDYSDGAGKLWHQPVLTTSMSWDDVAQICPRDGLTPCNGSAGSRDLTGWVWATSAQVVQLMSQFDPTILTSPTQSVQNVMAGISFVGVFLPTSSFATTYSISDWTIAWTATRDSAGGPTVGYGGWGTPPHHGTLAIASGGDPSVGSSIRGVFLWRADGSDGRVIVAQNDAGTVASPYGGTAVANILANDALTGATPTTGTVIITQLSSNNSGVTINPANGSVKVAAGTPAGSAALSYRICERANPSNCAQANVAVTIAGNIIDAVNDVGSAMTGGGIAVSDVRTNDHYGVPVRLSTVTTSSPAITLDATSGSVRVGAGTPAGLQSLVYRLCEAASPTNCDTATVTVTVSNYPIDAIDDQGSVSSSTGGIAVASVLTNDRFNGVAATLGNVTLSTVSSTSAGVTLDVSSGAVRVAPQTPSGAYTLTYRICERSMPGNCDAAGVVVSVAPQSIVVSSSRLSIVEGSGGSFTARLSQPPVGTLTVSVAFYAGTATLTPTVTSLVFTTANWNVPATVTFNSSKDSDKNDNAGTIRLTAANVAPASVVVAVLDKDRSSKSPTAAIASLLNGQSVSGSVAFTGTAVDSDGWVVDGKFSVDGVRISTDANTSGSYRVAGGWNSASVANGWHTLELRVTDNAGNDGRVTIVVLVSN